MRVTHRNIEFISMKGGAAALLAEDLPESAVGFAWLGQAGFAVRFGNCRLLIDPYLSDFLEWKYRGTSMPHDRMMPAPVHAAKVAPLDWVLCSHRHSDHMDPGSLPAIASGNPRCRFVVPRAEAEVALKAGIPANQMIGINAGETLRLDDRLMLHVLASAHEKLQTNERGEHSFLGFVLNSAAMNIYHSGDTVLFNGLAEQLSDLAADAALLPVNGRGRGVPGNLTFAEAEALCRGAHIPILVPHHVGMFAFNTVDPVELKRAMAAIGPEVRCLWPTTDSYWLVVRSGGTPQQHS